MVLGVADAAAPARLDDERAAHRPSIGHIPALDGLRGAAVIAVVLFHAEVIRGGYLGVDAFFVLSGFLITSLLVAEVGRTGTVDLGDFWKRRFRRLLPALLVMLLGAAVYATRVKEANALGQIRGGAIATLAYVANWFSINQDHSYWAIFQDPSPLDHTWSLAIEEQFYLVWPVIVFAVTALILRRSRRAGRVEMASSHTARAIFILTIVVALASSALMWLLYEPDTDPSRVYMGTDTRVAAILVGAGLAAWVAWRGNSSSHWTVRRSTLEVAAAVAVIGLGIAWFVVDGSTNRLYQGGFLGLGVAMGLVIAASAHPVRGPVAWAFSFRPLCLAGLISYGWYLWHWPVFLFVNEDRTGLEGTQLAVVRIVASLIPAILSYHLIEMPIRQQRIRITRPLLVPAAAIAVAGVVVLATLGGTPAPLPADIGTSLPMSQRDLEPIPTFNMQHRVLVVGDSVASSLALAAPLLGDQDNIVVGDGAENGCHLTAEVTALRLEKDGRFQPDDLNPPCLSSWKEAMRLFEPDQVVVVFGTALSFEQVKLNGSWVKPCDPAYQDWHRARLTAALSDVIRSGVNVSVSTLPYPVAPWVPDDARARIDCVNHVNVEVATAIQANVVDLAERVCPAGECIVTLAGEPLRIDGVHFTGEWTSLGFESPYPGVAAAEMTEWLVSQALEGRPPGFDLTVPAAAP